MTKQEKVLYHQIHPAKIAADVLAAFTSFYFFWQHQLLTGLLFHIGLPIAGSALVIQFADLDRLAASPLGTYVGKHMGALPQAVRLAGDIAMSFGAWWRNVYVMAGGLAVIVLAWLNGSFVRRSP